MAERQLKGIPKANYARDDARQLPMRLLIMKKYLQKKLLKER